MQKTLDVLCAGIIVADHLCEPISHCPKAGELVLTSGMLLSIGGCAANASVDLSKMGLKVAVIGRVGEDLFGSIVKQMLLEEKVDVSHIQATPGMATSQTLIVNVQQEDRRYVHTFGANAVFTVADIPEELLAQTKILYVGGYLLMPRFEHTALASLFQKAQSLGVKTVLDVGIPGPGDYQEGIRTVLPFTDVFLPNNDEAERILGETDPQKQADAFFQMGAKTVVVTLGKDGSLVRTADSLYRAGIFQVDFVDGSGSGDAFDAGYMVGLCQGYDVPHCIRIASALGASCVRKVGTTPGVFTARECEEFLGQNELIVDAILIS